MCFFFTEVAHIQLYSACVHAITNHINKEGLGSEAIFGYGVLLVRGNYYVTSNKCITSRAMFITNIADVP